MANQLTTNTTTIDELIAMANALPDAGSGSGGSVETCSVTIQGNNVHASYSTYIDGEYGIGEKNDDATVTLDNVVCGSLIYVIVYVQTTPTLTVNNGNFLFSDSSNLIDASAFGWSRLLVPIDSAGGSVTLNASSGAFPGL